MASSSSLYPALGLLALSLLGSPALAHQDNHVHGIAHLNFVLQGQDLELQIQSPGMELLGFEHQARTDSERAAVAQLTQTLTQNNGLVSPNAAARCTQVAAQAHPAHHKSHDTHHPHRAEGHDEWQVQYRFHCQDPAALNRINLGWFQAFPNTVEFRFQADLPSGQMGGTVKANQPEIRW